MAQSPVVQQPQTPQFNVPQQLYPQLPTTVDVPPIPAGQNRRPQVARGLQYKDNSFDAQRQQQLPHVPPQTGFNIDQFRLLSVLGRGHFGKVILSQYKKTGTNCHLATFQLY